MHNGTFCFGRVLLFNCCFFLKSVACVYLKIEELCLVLRAEVGDICTNVCYYKSSFLADS